MQDDIVKAIQTGDVATLNRLVSADPELVHVTVDGERTLLHVATDWPGHFPNVRKTISTLLGYGADVNAQFRGRHSESPLHWAASSDDLEALNTLLEHGADIEAPGAVIGGGTPLSDAVAFGQWRAARRLIEVGARCALWQAAALGMMELVEEYLANDSAPAADLITEAFWSACHGGQLVAAKRLLICGAELNSIRHQGSTALDAAMKSRNLELVEWLREQGAISAE